MNDAMIAQLKTMLADLRRSADQIQAAVDADEGRHLKLIVLARAAVAIDAAANELGKYADQMTPP